jgi:hypothetical protein
MPYLKGLNINKISEFVTNIGIAELYLALYPTAETYFALNLI